MLHLEPFVFHSARHFDTFFSGTAILERELIKCSERIKTRIQKTFINALPVFGFNSAKNDCNLIEPNLLPILINKRQIEPGSSKKQTKQFFQFGDIQPLGKMNFLGGATIFNYFHESKQTFKIESFCLTNGSVTLNLEKMRVKNFSRSTRFTVNYVALILLKLKLQQMSVWCKVDQRESKMLSNWCHQSHPLQK